MKTKITLAIVILVFVGLALFIFITPKTDLRSKDIASSKTNEETILGISLREILAKGENLICTTSYGSGGSGFSATIYMSDNKARIDTKSSIYDPNKETVEEKSYVTMLDSTSPNSAPFDIDNKFFIYKCESWEVDQSLFEV